MTPRQQYALLNPLADAAGDARSLDRYKRVQKHATGLLLMTVLAVDR